MSQTKKFIVQVKIKGSRIWSPSLNFDINQFSTLKAAKSAAEDMQRQVTKEHGGNTFWFYRAFEIKESKRK